MTSAVPGITLTELADGLGALELSSTGHPEHPVATVDLDAAADATDEVLDAATAAASHITGVLVGVANGVPSPRASRVMEELAVTLVPHAVESTAGRCCVGVADGRAAVSALAAGVIRSPLAAVAMTRLLRLTAQLPVPDGLVAESMTYSMLLAGPEFQAWRAATPRREVGEDDDVPVLVSRDDEVLRVVLNRPRRHNAFSRGIRDGVVEAMTLARLDRSLRVELTGNGRSFCSGGDLDEFGTTPDVATAHLIRLRQSAGAAVHECADRVRAVVHGACIGAGIEVPAFARHVAARADAYFQLPELSMGLVPGAGGTVSITRRIGRWRAAYLALTGHALDLETALRWGLVDARSESAE